MAKKLTPAEKEQRRKERRDLKLINQLHERTGLSHATLFMALAFGIYNIHTIPKMK